MQILLIFIAYIALFYSIYKIFFWFQSRKKAKELYNIMEIYFLEHHFKVNVKKIELNHLLNTVALSNAFIFTVVLMSTMLIKNIIIRILIMFALLLPVIYLVYYVVAKALKKERNKNNV